MLHDIPLDKALLLPRLTALAFFACRACIVVVLLSCFTGAAVADHRRAAAPAKELAFEKIFDLGFRLAPDIPFVCLDPLLTLLKELFVDDGRATVLDDDVAPFECAYILLVLEHSLERIETKRRAGVSSQALSVQLVRELSFAHALCIFLKDVSHDRRLLRNDNELFIFDPVAIRSGAGGVMSLQRCLSHSSRYVLRELLDIHLSHSLKDRLEDHALVALSDTLGRGDHLDVILFQLMLVHGRGVAVTREAVEFPYDDIIEFFLCRVRDHALKRRALVCRA